ncbi:MAG: hypothetical protein QOF10_4767 [Kribbellaceae bacterium]|jgi:hypothetical protein|nr:hypothetical protein [Kribbellaceae bacterium]
MTRTNRAIIISLIDSIDQFEAGDLEIGEIQGKLQVSVDLMEREPQNFASVVSLAEADLEGIQFTMLLDEQRPAAAFRLDSLRTVLQSALEADGL